MSYQTIELRVEQTTAVLTLNRPSRLNAWNGTMVRELEQAWQSLAEDDGVRLVIVTGAGRGFCSGADLEWFRPDVPGRDFRRQALAVHTLFDSIELLEKPVLAAINGLCGGGGLELALACDMRFASAEAQLGFPEVRHGLMPGSGGCSRLARVVGLGRAKGLVMSGELIAAAEAERFGLVNRVVEPDSLLDEVRAYGQRLVANGPLAVGMAKQVLNSCLDVDRASGRVLERLGQSLLLTTEDVREGRQAFQEKRAARYSAR